MDTFKDLKRETVDNFEIVFKGLGLANMVILEVGVIPGDGSAGGVDVKVKKMKCVSCRFLPTLQQAQRE